METRIREGIVRASLKMAARGWVANHDGNASAKVASNRFVCTPTATAKDRVRAQDLVVTDAAGKRLMRVETFEPVSENPVFTLQRGALAGPVDARGRDNNGNAFDARIAP